MLRLLNGIFGELAGLVPVAMTIVVPHSRIAHAESGHEYVWDPESWHNLPTLRSCCVKVEIGDIDFGSDDRLHPESQVRHRDFLFDAIVDPIDALILETREV